MPATTTHWAFATSQPRFNLGRTEGLSLAPRRTSNVRRSHDFLLRRRRLDNHTVLPTISLRGRTHNAHGGSTPVTMDRNAGALITLEGHHSLVSIRILAGRSRRCRDVPSLRGSAVAHHRLLLRHRHSILRGTGSIRRARRSGRLSPNHRNLGGDDLLIRGDRLGHAGHRRQARLLARTHRRSVGRIVLRHLSRTDSIRVRRLSRHKSSTTN